MTILLYPDLEPAKAPMLTIVMGLAVVQGVQRALGIDTKIKWPNDAVLNRKKLCGILTEMSAQIDYIIMLSSEPESMSIRWNFRKKSRRLRPHWR